MEFLVCQFKQSLEYFITTRVARETMLGALGSIGEQPDSIVLEKFPTHEEASNYKTEMEKTDKQIDQL